MNEVFVHNEISRIENQYLYSTDEPEPSYEEKLESLGENQLVKTLVENGMESVVLELIVKKLIDRYNEVIKRRAKYKAMSESLLESDVPQKYAAGVAQKGMARAITEELSDFLIENFDGNYDYSPALRELIRFNSIEV